MTALPNHGVARSQYGQLSPAAPTGPVAIVLPMKAVSLFPLLFLLPLSAAAETLQLSDQRVLHTDLAEARLISELDGYAIVAGRSCIDCDENTSIYIHRLAPPDNGGEEGVSTTERYTYPGKYVDYQSKELVEKTRMFYGRCYENRPALLWLSEYREDSGWVKSEYLIVLGEDGLEHRYNENRQPSVYYIENERCKELPGIAAETEP